MLGGALALAAGVAVAGWRAVYGRRWDGVEEGFRRPIAILAIAVTTVALLVAVRAARGRAGGLVFGALAVVVSATAAADVMQRAARHGAPVVDVLLPIVAVVASVTVLCGAVFQRR